LAMTRCWRRGLMRRIGRHEEEEWSLVSRGFTDEVRRLARQHIGEVVLRLLSVIDQGAILVECVVELTVWVTCRRAAPIVPTGRHVCRGRGVGVAVQVFAHEARAVPSRLDPCPDR